MKLGLIRTRLTIFYTIVVFVLLIFFCAFLYLGLRSLLNWHFNQRLLTLAESIEDSYSPADRAFNFLQQGTENYETARSGWIRIVGKDSSYIFKSDHFRKHNVPFPFAEAAALKLDGYYYREFSISGNRQRSVILPVVNSDSEEEVGWVEAAEPLKNIENSLSFFQRLILFSLPVFLLAVAAASFFMVDRAIRPVSIMARRTENISHKNLNERLPVLNPGDELGRLARRFNDLLSRLQHSFEQQRQLIGNISHELKTPLSILRAHWESEIANHRLPASLRQRLASDIEELARLSKMIDDLSLLARSLEMRPDFFHQKVELTGLLEYLFEDVRILADSKNQKFEFQAESGVFILGEETYLKRLFLNLLDNSIKYTPENGAIAVTCSVQDGRAVVTIRDNGIGIRREDIPRIFDRFYRTDQKEMKNIKGSGLGLPIARWIAEAHCGQLHVGSDGENGTAITVELPLAPEA